MVDKSPSFGSGSERARRREDTRSRMAEVIGSTITPAKVIANLHELHDTVAPSGTVLYTRTPVIERLLTDSGIPKEEFSPQFLGTRSPAVLLNAPKKLWFTPHSDQIAYIPPFTNETAFDITPISAHRPKESKQYPEFSAAVLRFNPKHKLYEIVSTGVIGTDLGKNGGIKPYYVAATKPKDGFHPGYDRVAYTPQFVYNQKTGLIEANNDNAAGVAATITALEAVKKIADMQGIQLNQLPFGVAFPDEEEGSPESSAFFGREARRMAHRLPTNELPTYVVDVDGHDTVNDADPAPVATYGAYVSGGKGAIVPPDIYAVFDTYLQGLKKYGVTAVPTESVAGTVSRSNDVGFMEVHGQVVPVGYMGRDPHHNKGISTTNVHGLVNTSKAIAWIAADMLV